MALFKVCRGNETNLPRTKNDGYAYFCTDTGNFFIDWASTDGTVTRVQINSDCAYKLRYQEDGEYVEIDAATVNAHLDSKNNPHGVTKSQVGLGNVDNTSDASKPVSTAQAAAIADAKKAGTDAQSNLNTHANNKSNPHGVGLTQLGVTATAAELNYVDGVTSNIQTQLNQLSTNIAGKAPSEHTHDYPVDSVNGKTGVVTLGASDVGAIAKGGDTMTGWLGFDGTVGPEWITADGTRFAVRAYKDGNLFQITTTPPGGSQHASFNIKNDGSVWFGNADAARSSLGITPANIGAAPAVLADMVKAFGINTNYILDVQNSNFDTLTTNGIYKGLKGSATGFPDQLGEWAFVLNLSYDDGGQFGVQFAWDMIGYTICHRYKRNGTWNAWKTPNLIQTHQFWADCGKAASGTFSCVGYYTVTNYGNGLFRVLFHGSSQTIAADTFEYGVRADWLLSNINATFGTSFTGISHKSSAIDVWRYDNGLYAKDGAGFGYCFQERRTSDAIYLVPARVHTSAGNVGQWALNSINNYWGADAMVNFELWLQLS